MAKSRMNRRRFLTQMASAGLVAPLAISGRAAAQTGPAPPTNVRLVSSPPPSTGTSGRQLLGGWRLNSGAPAPIAIDFSRMKLWHGRQEYDLPPMGGPDPNTWPRLSPARLLPSWGPTSQAGATSVYWNGLVFWKGKLWAAPRFFYAVDPAASLALTLYAQDGEQITVPGLTAQKFAGFVKRGPGLEPLLGCGGYESGQGSQSGPSLATLNGQKLLEYGWPGLPGANLENWNQRAPRDTNYRAFDVGFEHDSWVAWVPRDTNGDGVKEGRWASDRIYGGGLVLPDGIHYWPLMGVGDIDYREQTSTFAKEGSTQTYDYRYDPTTYRFLDYRPDSEVGAFTVHGHELGPDGKVYLAVGYNWWYTGQNTGDTGIKVFG